MEPQLAMSLVLVLVLVASFIWFAHRTKSTPLPPRDQQEGYKALLVIGLTFWFLILGIGVLKGDLMTVRRSMSFFGCTVFVLAVGYGAFRKSTNTEVQKNYSCDQTHCGQCGYDLTGNISGVCPECGWVIPEKPGPLERADWALWWRKWEIDYLEHWCASLAAVILAGAAVFVIALGFWFQGGLWPVAVPLALYSVHCFINAGRVIAYSGRERTTHSSKE